MRFGRLVSALVVVLAPISGIGVPNAVASTGSDYRPKIDPADFTSEITNPYFPLTPGTTFVYGQPPPGLNPRVCVPRS
jgi:hypothetical protein